MSDHLHIVCLDAPAPPDYGGAIDMYYKIVALAQTGKKIILHYFDYKPGRGVQGLEPYCAAIHAYPRKNFFSGPFSLPYIVRSRSNKELIGRLNADDHPILLEGLHTSGIIKYLKRPERAVIRMHNEEAAYYGRLVPNEKNLLRRVYFGNEASALKRYYKQLPRKVKMACLSNSDIDVLRNQYGFQDLHFIPCFVPWTLQPVQPDKGSYCLYHGNLGVPENDAAAIWLVTKVFSALDIPFVIAGKNPSAKLMALCKKYRHVRLIPEPPIDELAVLVRDAQVNVLPSLNTTGVKLKLLHSLFTGRFCVVNQNGVAGSGIEQGVTVAETPEEFREAIRLHYEELFTETHLQQRAESLHLYNNARNADQLLAICR